MRFVNGSSLQQYCGKFGAIYIHMKSHFIISSMIEITALYLMITFHCQMRVIFELNLLFI